MVRSVGRRLIAIAVAVGAAGIAQAACKVSAFAEIPITMAGARPMLEARIGGQPLRFLADSGAFWSVISPGTAAELHLPLQPVPVGFHMEGVGGSADVRIARVKDLQFAGQRIPPIEFLVGGSEPGGAGVIGQNVLALRDTEYDLAHGVIRLMEHEDCSKANFGYWAGPDQNVEIEDLLDPNSAGKHIEGAVTVNGVKLRAYFDTGASSSGISVQAAARAGVHLTDKGVEPNGVVGGFGRSMVRNWIAHFASLGVGSEQVRNIRLRIVDYGDQPFDMLIGADFFLSHRIYVAPAIRRMFFTYNGGPVFNLTAEPPTTPSSAPAMATADPAPSADLHAATTEGSALPAPGEPTDADGFARRGAAAAARGQLGPALADMDRAVTMAPSNAAYLVARARLHAERKEPLRALADLDTALMLAPADTDALLFRIELRLKEDRAGARADADRLAAALSPQADQRLMLARIYEALTDPDDAIAQDSLWIKAHPDDSRMPQALNGRCWARALAGRDLPQALADCDIAARRTNNEAAILDSRGLVKLRMGNFDAAIADYDRALATNPKIAWSQYGRGIARLAKGQKAEGEADLAAAAAANPEVPALARRYGIVPPAG